MSEGGAGEGRCLERAEAVAQQVVSGNGPGVLAGEDVLLGLSAISLPMHSHRPLEALEVENGDTRKGTRT